MALDLRSRTATTLGSIRGDALYRGSFFLLTNTAALSAFGFVFWALAARNYPAAAVGTLSGLVAGISLLATVAALGLPNMVTRSAASTPDLRGLMAVAVAAIVTAGSAACLATVLVLGPHLPAALHLRQRGAMVIWLAVLVVSTAAGGALDACLIATRASHAVLVKNLAASAIKVGAVLLLSGAGPDGLLLGYSLGVCCSAGFSGAVLARRLGGARARGRGARSFSAGQVRRYLARTGGNYLATLMGILPTTVVPIEVLAQRGRAGAARFAVAFMVAGFLNSLPSVVAQVMFAEASRGGGSLTAHLRKAAGEVYALVVPALIVLLAAAPLVLGLFGPAYAAASAGCLRVLALSSLLTCGTYLVDSALLARDHTGAYLIMNGANAALVLGGVAALLPRGLTAAAWGWLLAQGLSLLLGLAVLAALRRRQRGAGRGRWPRGASRARHRRPAGGWVGASRAGRPDPVLPGRRILVIGAPRSGTTWVARALGRVPGARLVHEPDNELIDPFAVRAKAGLGRYPVLAAGDAAPGYDRLWAAALTSGRPARSPRGAMARAGLRYIPESWIEQAVDGGARPGPRAVRAASALLARPRCGGGRPGVLVAKSVHAAFAIDFITARWPAEVVLVSRNPLNAIASWLELGFRQRHFEADDRVQAQVIERLGLPRPQPGDHVTGVAYTYLLLAASLRARAAENPGWHLVRHDDLCADPLTGFADLLGGLGFPLSGPVRQWIGESDRAGSGYETSRIAAAQAGRWRERLTAEQARRVSAIAGEFGFCP